MSKRRKKKIAGGPGITSTGNPGSGTWGDQIWSSPNFSPSWQPPRRSWPFNPTKLELLAERAGINDEDFRVLLRDEVERRLAERELADERRET